MQLAMYQHINLIAVDDWLTELQMLLWTPQKLSYARRKTLNGKQRLVAIEMLADEEVQNLYQMGKQ